MDLSEMLSGQPAAPEIDPSSMVAPQNPAIDPTNGPMQSPTAQVPPVGHDQRMATIRDLLTNFMYSFGRGLEANKRGSGNTAIGAAILGPFELSAYKQQLALQKQKQDLENAQTVKTMAGIAQAQQTIDMRQKQLDQDSAPVEVVDPDGKTTTWPAKMAQTMLPKGWQIKAQIGIENQKAATSLGVANINAGAKTADEAARQAAIDARSEANRNAAMDRIKQGGIDAMNRTIQQGKDRVAAAGIVSARADTARTDKSYSEETNRVETAAKPVRERLTRLHTIQDSLDQKSQQADALIAPELLTAMAGGQGSGLRMNEAEITRIIGGRNAWEELKSRVSRYRDTGEPFLVRPEQRQQIQKLLDAASGRATSQLTLVDNASAAIAAAKTPDEARQARINLEKALDQPRSLQDALKSRGFK